MENNQEEINVIDYMALIIRGKKTIIIFCILGIVFALAVFFMSAKRQTVYQSSAIIELGTVAGEPVENIESLVAKVNNSSFKNPSPLTAASIPGTKLITLKISSATKDDAVSLSAVASAIVSAETSTQTAYKDAISAKITKIEAVKNSFISMGQQSALLQESIFALQDQLANIVAPKIIKEPEVSSVAPSKLMFLFMIVVGALFGIFAGVCVVFFKAWWRKNKTRLTP